MGMTKAELRLKSKAEVRKYDTQQRKRMSDDICSAIISTVSKRLTPPCPILLFWPLPDEVDIRPAVMGLYELGYRVYLPVVVGENLEIRLFEGVGAMKEGAFHIMEPVGQCLEKPLELDAAFIPGMAFSPDGRRLGRGKGYYDRLLQQLDCPLYGVCFPCQIMEQVPVEVHDINVNEVISI